MLPAEAFHNILLPRGYPHKRALPGKQKGSQYQTEAVAIKIYRHGPHRPSMRSVSQQYFTCMLDLEA